MTIGKSKLKNIMEKIENRYSENKTMDTTDFKKTIQQYQITRFYVITQFNNMVLIIDGCKEIIEHDGLLGIRTDEGNINIESKSISRISEDGAGMFKIYAGQTTVFLIPKGMIEVDDGIKSIWSTPYYDKGVLRYVKQHRYWKNNMIQNKSDMRSQMIAGNHEVRIYRKTIRDKYNK